VKGERAGLPTLNEAQSIEYEIESNRGKESAVRLKAVGRSPKVGGQICQKWRQLRLESRLRSSLGGGSVRLKRPKYPNLPRHYENSVRPVHK
jgi:hypothetical protein